MDTVIALACIAFFMAITVLLYGMEVKRHKVYIAKEEEQTALYKKISRKLDEM